MVGSTAETQRRPVPRVDADERETALASLDFQRMAMLIECDGLSDDQLRPASGSHVGAEFDLLSARTLEAPRMLR